MFDYSDNGITVSAMLDTRRANKLGLFPAKIRVTYQRQRQYYSTGKCLAEDDWEKLLNSRSRELNEIRSSIQVTAEKVRDAIKELIKSDTFSFEALNKRLGNATGDTLNTAFTAKIESLRAQGKVSTADWYKYTLRSIKLFAGKQVKYSQVTIDWLQRYEKSLLKENKSYTTISMYMRALQVIINEAKSAGVIKPSQHPFGKGKYEIPQHEGRNIALTIGEIAKIVDYQCKTETEERCRDLWFFSYLCNGANITDICKLKFSNIDNGEISFYRQKTIAKAKKKKQIHAVITPEMQAIIEKWGNSNSEPNNYIFSFLLGDETPEDERRIIKNITSLMNKKMKDIGKELGIGSISTYTARHSYATVLKRSGANMAYISETLGHSDLKTTENYMARFEKEERLKNAALLTNFKKAS
ncbi:site-specific integrase [Pontibacter sp. JH31]|uniref:Site-specific integrase n=1 Tax=Pontibacter aquaedesilientis TaxID=2766980 RepID=A0ABR7XH69_9BACT|nr:site-specific integrase [Pontibacter aquaedesilientis]MBD1396746.1 site-specific integrase [Pontibacter aquaedesilientis]